MYNIIDQLHLDHINVSKVLNLLTQQYEIMQTDEAPDYILISDILDYFHNYPDYIHHPKENAVFEEYLKGYKWNYNPDNQYRGELVEFDRNTIHNLASVTKSFTSCLVGIAIDQNYIQST